MNATFQKILAASSAITVCASLLGCMSNEVADTSASIKKELADRVETRAQARADSGSGNPTASADDLPVISGRLSVDDAIKLAMANNRPLKTAYLRRKEAEGLILQAYAGALPNASASSSAMQTLPDEGNSDTYSVGVEVTQPLWRSGSVAAGLRYAKLYAASTDFTIREQVQATVYEVVSKYMNVILRQHLVQVYEEAAAVSERVLKTAKSRRQQGTVSDYDVLRAEVEVANTSAELINGRNALQSTMVALFQTMGVSQDSNVEFAGELEYSAEAFELEAASAKAAVERPDIARAQAALHMAEERIHVVKSEYGPSADAFASGDYSNAGRGGQDANGDWNDAWTIGAKVSLTLFDGFERRGKVIEATSKRDQAAETLRDTEDKAHVEVVNALLQLKYADELYNSQKKNIELAKEALRILEAGSSRGRNTQIEVLDARSALTEAMGAYYRAVHAQGLARLAIRNAMGTLSPDDPMEPIVKPMPAK